MQEGLDHPQILTSALGHRHGEKWMALNSIMEVEIVALSHIWGLKEGQRGDKNVSDL